jgi:electron transport complex protein RnfG
MDKTIIKHAVITALILAAFTVVGTAILSGTFEVTKTPIAESERQAKLQLLSQVMPASLHDNDLLNDSLDLPATPELGLRSGAKVYRARMKGAPAGVVLEAIAPDGYSGEIKLLIGVAVDGSLTGVRVLAHKETPGLGDYIELAHSDWIKHFDGQSLARTPDEGWKVKKDGGQFEYMTGATITPRAVVKAVHKALKYYEQSHEQLFATDAAKQEGEHA